VGALEGIMVGNLDGTIVGAHVGPVGAEVGAAVGPTDQNRIPYPFPTFMPVRDEISEPLE
jgi:hypothetical protein